MSGTICQECPLNTFKPELGDHPCTTCPLDMTTCGLTRQTYNTCGMLSTCIIFTREQISNLTKIQLFTYSALSLSYACFLAPVWSDWSICTSKCGGGIRVRTTLKYCNTPSTLAEDCNTQKCTGKPGNEPFNFCIVTSQQRVHLFSGACSRCAPENIFKSMSWLFMHSRLS